jgi:para-nitrobenzyl esterase
MADNEIIVETDCGRLRGVRERGVCAFRGVPYGEDTSGANRFRPPRAVTPWTGVRDALAYGPTAVQLRPPVNPERAADPLAEGQRVGEDCLVLNVWTPDTSGRRPVMVWFHGGGFSVGSASSPLYDGTELARRGDVVVVSVNHRLGLLGFLQLESLFGEEYAGSGNAGLLDLIASLQWVARNVERFGGDPGCVTIFGESGGGGKVSALLSAPAARGLFRRAIVQSGPPFQFPDMAAATTTAEKVLAQLGVDRRQGPSALHELPAHKLLAAQVALGAGGGPSPGGMAFAPAIDRRVLLDWPEPALATGSSADIPLLIGTNLDEARFMLMTNPSLRKEPPELSPEELLERVSPGCDANAGALIARYRALYPDLTPFDLLLKIESEQFRLRSIRLAEHKLKAGGAPVFMYLLCWTTPRLARYGAYHGIELPFLFRTFKIVPHLAADPEAEALSRRMQQVWVEFARTGRPAGDDVPAWTPYTQEERATMCIDRAWSVERDPFGRERRAWDDVPTGPTTRPWSRVSA